MKTSNVFICIGILVAAVFLYVDKRTTTAQIRSLHEELARVRADAQMEHEGGRDRPAAVADARSGRIALLHEPDPALAPAPSANVAAPLKSTPATRVREPRRPSTPVEDYAPFHRVLESAFEAENVDGAWAREASSLVGAGLMPHLPQGSRINSVDCHSSMCRVESTHENRTRANQLIEDALGEPKKRPWNGGFATGPVVEDKETGRVTTVTYLMREGMELPDVDLTAEELLE